VGNLSFALQAGAACQLSDRRELFSGYRRAWLSADAKSFPNNAAVVQAAVKRNRDLVSASVKFHLAQEEDYDDCNC
jgi:hypothetical protein